MVPFLMPRVPWWHRRGSLAHSQVCTIQCCRLRQWGACMAACVGVSVPARMCKVVQLLTQCSAAGMPFRRRGRQSSGAAPPWAASGCRRPASHRCRARTCGGGPATQVRCTAQQAPVAHLSSPATKLMQPPHTLRMPSLSQSNHTGAAPGSAVVQATPPWRRCIAGCCCPFAGAAAGPGAAQQQLALMRQRSIALQQAVAQSRLGSAVAKSRFASASRRWGTRLQPLVNAKVADPALCTPSCIHARAAAWLLWRDAVLAGAMGRNARWCQARPGLAWTCWSAAL